MRASRGGHPDPVNVDRGQRIPSGAYPRKSGEILSQRPTIHRPHRARRAEPFGIRLSCPSTAPPRETRDDVVSVGDRGPLPRLERDQHAQPPVEGPASTRGKLIPRGACPFSPGHAWPVKGWTRRRRGLPPSMGRRGRVQTGRARRRFDRGKGGASQVNGGVGQVDLRRGSALPTKRGTRLRPEGGVPESDGTRGPGCTLGR